MSRNPDYNNDGTKIAFTGMDGVSIMNSDGSNIRVLANGKYPQFSPNGSLMAYIGNTEGVNEDEVMIMKSDGTNIRQLTTNGRNNSFPQFSPDGEQIAFSSYNAEKGEIFIMDINGNNLRQISSSTIYNSHVRFQYNSITSISRE